MHLNQVRQMTPLWYKARSPIYLKSPPGTGKTETIEDSIPELSKMFNKNLGIVKLNGGDMNVADTIGYLMPRDRGGVFTSEFSLPFWWFTEQGKAMTEFDGGVLFCDELDKAPVDVKKIVGELMHSGRCGPHRLPPGWVVWGAGNRDLDRSGSTKELFHLINRRVEINVSLNVQAWMDWAFAHGIHPTFIAYAEKHPEVVFPTAVPEKLESYCTPRAFARCARDMMVFADEATGKLRTDSLAKEHVAGTIGHGAVASLFSYIELGQDMPNFNDIIRDPTRTKLPTRADTQMLVCYHLAARVDVDSMDPVVTYVERLPKEFSVSFAKAACRRDTDLLDTPAITRWCIANHSLMTAIRDRS